MDEAQDVCSPAFTRTLVKSIAYSAFYLVDMCLAFVTFWTMFVTLTAAAGVVIFSGVGLLGNLFPEHMDNIIVTFLGGLWAFVWVPSISAVLLSCLVRMINAPSFLVASERYLWRTIFSFVFDLVDDRCGACFEFFFVTWGYKWVLSSYFERKFY